MPLATAFSVLLTVASGFLQLCISWLFKTFAAVSIMTIAAHWLRARSVNVQHDQQLEEVRKTHAELMQRHEQITPKNRPPLSVYAMMAEGHRVFEDLPEPETDLDKSPQHLLAGTDAPPSKENMIDAATTNILSQSRTTIKNSSTVVIQLTCLQAPSVKEYLTAGETYTLPEKIPMQATVLMAGYKADFSTVDFSVFIDQRSTLGIVISDVQGDVQLARVQRSDREHE